MSCSDCRYLALIIVSGSNKSVKYLTYWYLFVVIFHWPNAKRKLESYFFYPHCLLIYMMIGRYHVNMKAYYLNQFAIES